MAQLGRRRMLIVVILVSAERSYRARPAGGGSGGGALDNRWPSWEELLRGGRFLFVSRGDSHAHPSLFGFEDTRVYFNSNRNSSETTQTDQTNWPFDCLRVAQGVQV